MKQKLRAALFVLFALLFAGSAAMIIYQGVQYQQGDETYAEAEALVNLPDLSALPNLSDFSDSSNLEQSSSGDGIQTEQPTSDSASVYVDPYAYALRNMDFTALRQVNGDILGWILIPGTRLSYPLVQGEDNLYYLNHTWRKSRNPVGAIFLEYNNSGDFGDFNTIIYGHRMNNNSMFGTLKYYKDQNYWAAHPYIYISDDSGSRKYEVFSAYEVSVEGDTYRLGFSGDQTKQNFLDYCASQSVIDTDVVPKISDRVLTLSTCTGNGHATRWVVQAVLKGVASSSPRPPFEAPQQPSTDSSDSSDSSQSSQSAAPHEDPISQDIHPQQAETGSSQST